MTPDELTAAVARLRELATTVKSGLAIVIPFSDGARTGHIILPGQVTCTPEIMLALCDAVAELDALRSASDGASAARFGKTYIRPVFPAPADEWDDA